MRLTGNTRRGSTSAPIKFQVFNRPDQSASRTLHMTVKCMLDKAHVTMRSRWAQDITRRALVGEKGAQAAASCVARPWRTRGLTYL
jgi:hypothetical protein